MRAIVLVAVAATTAGAQPITHPADSLPDRLQPTISDSHPPPDDPSHLWTVGVLATPDQARYGVRLQVDLFSFGSWAAGIAGTAMQADPTLMTSDKLFTGEAFVAHAIDLAGPLRLRVQGGAGIGTRSSFVDASV